MCYWWNCWVCGVTWKWLCIWTHLSATNLEDNLCWVYSLTIICMWVDLCVIIQRLKHQHLVNNFVLGFVREESSWEMSICHHPGIQKVWIKRNNKRKLSHAIVSQEYGRDSMKWWAVVALNFALWTSPPRVGFLYITKRELTPVCSP
jgi:hypothetical protein